MDNIIKDIIEIDKTAQKKLDESQNMIDEMKGRLEAEKNKAREDISREYDLKIKEMKQAVDKEVEENRKQTELKKAENKQALDRQFAENAEQWEQELYDFIVSGGSDERV